MSKHYNVRALSHKVKCGCSVQRIRKNINNLTALKQATITLLDLLHLSRNKCIFFLNTASNVGMLDWTWWVMTTNTCFPGRVVQSPASKIIDHTQSLHAWLSEIPHNCDAYMGVQKERKSTFLTAFEHRRKRLAACLLQNIFIAVVSECLCHLGAQYPAQLPDICIG